MMSYLYAALAAQGILFVAWLWSLKSGKVSHVDILWGPVIVVCGWVSAINHGLTHRSLVVLILATTWSLRLAAYLCWRNWSQPEDRRYKVMRDKYPGFRWSSLCIVFVLQGGLAFVVSMPLQAVCRNDGTGWFAWDVVGFGLFFLGLYFESIGDWQLAGFLRKPESAGAVLKTGLWRYTRHPNYFGDFCVWWGLFILCIGNGSGWWSICSPLLMSWLLLRVSGTALLESTIHNRRPEYAEYVRQTNTFFPGKPKM